MSGSSQDKVEPENEQELRGVVQDSVRKPVSSRTEDGWTIDSIEESVSFLTEDGWTIHGTLTRPAALHEGGRVAAVLLLPSSAHDQDIFSRHSYPGFARLQNEFVTLRIDIRGRGKSEGQLEIHSFTPQQREQLYLDVRAALSFLASQKAVDPMRIAIFAEAVSADSAVLGAAGNPGVRAFAFVSGYLSAKAKEVISTSPDKAILCLVSSEDRDAFRDMSDGYGLSTNSKTNILVYSDLGHATAMFSTWRYNRPDERPLDYLVADWLVERLKALGTSRKVSFETEDGWNISADLVSPLCEDRAPAIILIHSSVTDRHMYHSLVQVLVEAGFAVLNMDWRGRGKSRNKGDWLELRLGSPEASAEADRGYLDIKAAIDFLSSQDNIDPVRIGAVGTVIGARFALLAAAKDPRLQTVVSVIGYVPPEPEKEELAGIKIPVLYILSQNVVPVARAMTTLYEDTKANGSKLVAFKGGAYGYGIFVLNREICPLILDWMRKKLRRKSLTNTARP
jgi:dienelactone hydrolase